MYKLYQYPHTHTPDHLNEKLTLSYLRLGISSSVSGQRSGCICRLPLTARIIINAETKLYLVLGLQEA